MNTRPLNARPLNDPGLAASSDARLFPGRIYGDARAVAGRPDPALSRILSGLFHCDARPVANRPDPNLTRVTAAPGD